MTTKLGEVNKGDLENLRRQGFNDRAIHETMQVIGYFNYINRIAEGLGVDYEDFIRPWEKDWVGGD